MRRFCATMVCLLVGACSSVSSTEQTLVAGHEAMGTQIVDLRQTATAAVDRMMITVEHAQTEVRDVQAKGTALASTLVANGFDAARLASMVPIPDAPDSTAAISKPVPETANAITGTDEASASSTDSAIPPLTLTPTEIGPPRLSNIAMTEGVGDNDCALSTTFAFTPESERIYVVAVASNIPPGTTLTSRWLKGGQAQVMFDYVPEFFIEQACIWFYIDQTDVTFTPGDWSVTLEINGQPVGPATSFQITG